MQPYILLVKRLEADPRNLHSQSENGNEITGVWNCGAGILPALLNCDFTQAQTCDVFAVESGVIAGVALD
jgi:hypothetical protein